MELGALGKVSDSEAQRNVRHPAERAQRARQRAVHRDAAHSARGPGGGWFQGEVRHFGESSGFRPCPHFLKGTPRRPGACACFSTISPQTTVYSLREPNVCARLVNPRDEGFFPSPSQIPTSSQQGLPQQPYRIIFGASQNSASPQSKAPLPSSGGWCHTSSAGKMWTLWSPRWRHGP